MSLSAALQEEFNPSKALYLARPKGYTVLNSTPEPFEFTWGGNTYCVPARDEVVYPHPKYPNDPTVPHSSQYSDSEEYIPGSLFVQDNAGRKERYGDQYVSRPWRSDEALRGAFGVDEYDNITGIAFKKGLSILDANPDKATVLKADQLGRKRWREWQLKNATTTVAAFERKNDSRRANNMSPMPPPQDVLEAQALLEAEHSKFVNRLRKEEKEEVKYLEQQLQQPVAQPSPQRSDEQLVDDLLARPDIKNKLKQALGEDYVIRKRRVKKSDQKVPKQRAAAKNSRIAKSAKIQVPED